MIDILIVLDRSGSMERGRSDHEGGLNSFIRDQSSLPGEVFLTFIQFDDFNPCEIIADRIPIRNFEEVHLVPRGGTPLFEAIGLSTSHLLKRQTAEPSDLTICMIVTDGQNTTTKEWTKPLVRERIAQCEARGWQVLFLGANIDAFEEGAALGINFGHSANVYNGTVGSPRAAYGTVSNRLAAVRMAGLSGQSVSHALSFNQDDYRRITKGERVAFDAGASTLDELKKSPTE